MTVCKRGHPLVAENVNSEGRCRECLRIADRVRYAANPEKWRTKSRRYRAENPEKHRAATARWKRAHPESNRASAKAWTAANRDRARVTLRLGAARRRARIAAATVILFTADQLEARIAYFGGRCWMCGGEAEQVDHVKPLTKGGIHALANLRPACSACNKQKNNRWPLLEVEAQPFAGGPVPEPRIR